jgi:hypothetical protein
MNGVACLPVSASWTTCFWHTCHVMLHIFPSQQKITQSDGAAYGLNCAPRNLQFLKQCMMTWSHHVGPCVGSCQGEGAHHQAGGDAVWSQV